MSDSYRVAVLVGSLLEEAQAVPFVTSGNVSNDRTRVFRQTRIDACAAWVKQHAAS